MLHCLSHGCPLRIEHRRFGITTTLAFIFSLYEGNGGAPMFFSHKKILSKQLGPR
jgi:hypothetical protein